MVATEETAQDLYRQLATGNQIAQAAKVGLQVVISKEELLSDGDGLLKCDRSLRVWLHVRNRPQDPLGLGGG